MWIFLRLYQTIIICELDAANKKTQLNHNTSDKYARWILVLYPNVDKGRAHRSTMGLDFISYPSVKESVQKLTEIFRNLVSQRVFSSIWNFILCHKPKIHIRKKQSIYVSSFWQFCSKVPIVVIRKGIPY